MKAHSILDDPEATADPVDCWIGGANVVCLSQSSTQEDDEGFPIEEHLAITLTLAQAEQLQAELPALLLELRDQLEEQHAAQQERDH